jgi:hypothetical protein
MPSEATVVSPSAVFSIGKGLYDLYMSQQREDPPPSLEAILGGVRTVFQEVLALQSIEESAAELGALQEQYDHYVNAPSGVDRLYLATQAASELVQKLQAPSIRVQGHQLWSVAVGLQIFILFERAKLDPNEIKNIVNVCKKAVIHHYGHELYVPESYNGLTEGMYQHWAAYLVGKYKREHDGFPPPLPQFDEIIVKPTQKVVFPINRIVIGYGLEAIVREELCRKIDPATQDSQTNFVMWEFPHVFGKTPPFRNRFLMVKDMIQSTPEWQHACGRG